MEGPGVVKEVRLEMIDNRRSSREIDNSVVRSSEVGRSSSAQGYMGVNWVSLAQNSAGWLFGPLASRAAADGDCKVPGLAK